MNIILKFLKSKNNFFINTSIIIFTGFIIKILGLINKIIITRYLGKEGMNLYILSFPTIILLLNISTLNINNCISKITSESIISKKYSTKNIIMSGIKITIISSIITILVFLLTIKPLVNIFLKNTNLYYPLLTSIILLPLTGISDTLKGYYNGIKNTYKSSLASLIEQSARILFVLIVLLLFPKKEVVFTTTLLLLALSFGEFISIIYLLIQIKKENLTSSKINPTKPILDLAIPSTFSKIIGNITYFLEPIVYMHILTFLNYSNDIIQSNYTIINAYTIPLLTSASFISIALSTSIIPNISENYIKNKFDNIKYYIDKTIMFSLIPGIIISILFFIYPKEYMNLIYGTNEGISLIKPFVFFFLLYYLQMPFSAILHAIGKIKIQFIISTSFSIVKIILIIVLSFIPNIGVNSIFFSILITMIIHSMTIIIVVSKYTKYHYNINSLLTLLLISISCLSLLFILSNLNIHFLINSFIIGILYTYLCYTFNLIKTKS